MKNQVLFDDSTFDYKGHTFHVSFPSDEDSTPFDFDGHGPVRKTSDRHAEGSSDKKPGERPLNQPDRREYQFYYCLLYTSPSPRD